MRLLSAQSKKVGWGSQFRQSWAAGNAGIISRLTIDMCRHEEEESVSATVAKVAIQCQCGSGSALFCFGPKGLEKLEPISSWL